MHDAPLIHRGAHYFDVGSPPTQLRYGDVNNDVRHFPLPDEVVQAFADKVMSITGWESNTEQLDLETGSVTTTHPS